EDGIRDWSVTGVQTCALPISDPPARTRLPRRRGAPVTAVRRRPGGAPIPVGPQRVRARCLTDLVPNRIARVPKALGRARGSRRVRDRAPAPVSMLFRPPAYPIRAPP